MASLDEQIADVDARIADIADKLATLRKEMDAVQLAGSALAKVQGLVAISEGRLRELRAHRAELERQRGGAADT